MTESHWQSAHAIAQTLVKQETDVNELGKTIAYLRSAINLNQAEAGARFFKYLKTLVNNGRTIGHSGRTLDYYRTIEKACSDYLLSYQTKPATMLHILGWVARLMRYYREGGAIEEDLEALAKRAPTISPQVLESERQAEIQAVAQTQNFQLRQQVEAVIKTIKGKAVTYELPGSIKLTVKEPKKYSDLEVGQVVTVEILEIRENGIPKKVQWVG
ncbi:hypothetical protein H6F51_04845 [Cyanobacteria bacterium FACHB-DQ100]|nr:hypothetical protein [Cyanobacteria bacterium FACHB-DQ100]